MKDKKIVIYGANGYTGKLFAKYLKRQGIRAILAARSAKVEPIAKDLGCETRIFSTDQASHHLGDIDALVNLAGPFAKTQNGLIEACIATKTHYFDIAGEVPELENAYAYHEKAKRAGIYLVPAAGFGVVPTDIAAKIAAERVAQATKLKIAYATEGGASRGTLYTVLKDINKPGILLKNGQAIKAMPASSVLRFKVADQFFTAVYNPWRADLFTAHLSTSIPNIETYSVFPSFIVSMMKGRLLWLRNLLLNRLLNWLPEGPTEKQLNIGKTYIWAEASNDSGEKACIEIMGPEAYLFTLLSLYKLLVLAFEESLEAGFKTPSDFGTNWLEALDEVKVTLFA